MYYAPVRTLKALKFVNVDFNVFLAVNILNFSF